MAYSSIDREGVSSARGTLAADPVALRSCAARVSAGAAEARMAVGAEATRLGVALERFRVVHATALDAMAQASATIGGDLVLVVTSSRETELSIAAGLGSPVAAREVT